MSKVKKSKVNTKAVAPSAIEIMREKTKAKLAEMKAEMDAIKAKLKEEYAAQKAKDNAEKNKRLAILINRAEGVVRKRKEALAKSEDRLAALIWAKENPEEVAKAKAAKAKERKLRKAAKKSKK